MLTEVHELSELLFKVKAGKADDTTSWQHGEDEMPEWDDEYFGSGSVASPNGVAAAESSKTTGSDSGRMLVTSSGKYQNTFTITEIQSKPFSKKRAGKKRR